MLVASPSLERTPPTSAPLAADLANMQHAIESAAAGLAEGGVPIGACLVNNRTGEVLGVGRNRRVQMGSAIRHGETDCLENVGRLPASVYRECTMYTTLSPCAMCTGACILYEIPRIVIGENESFFGAEQTLKAHGIEVVNMGMLDYTVIEMTTSYTTDLQECKVMMREFIDMKPEVWWEDIGEEKRAKEA